MPNHGLRWSQLIGETGLIERWDGPCDPVVTSVLEDSRQVTPGACFVAATGLRADGHAFVEAAVEKGAVAVVSERPVALPPGVAGLVVGSSRGVAGRLAATLYGLDKAQRDGRLRVIGITGTNGKSTFCFMMRSILQVAQCPTALLGTIEYDLLARKVTASMTTPPATAIMSYLAEAFEAGATHAVMEASSHALDQDRCAGIRFSVGAFSNLTGDHLDYHRDMESYLRAKKKLFDGLDSSAAAVVNMDDPHGDAVAADCRGRVIRYGVQLNASRPDGRVPDVCAIIKEISASGTRFVLVLRGTVTASGREESCELCSPLIGNHNVQNSLAAAGSAIALGVPLVTVVAGLEAAKCIPGRLQRVETPAGRARGDRGFTVLVDYAHTDDALKNVLSALKPLVQRSGGRLIVMFGCGGDRDRTKRPRMARVAAEWADRIVVTSDNPRTEEPMSIIEEIMTGFDPSDVSRVCVEADRRKAIEAAIGFADRGDIVLLAGKGHETYQEIGRERFPFDDSAVAAEVLSGLR
ncbi:MAG TPA: UDP-N-acetylmuramoyl-L-alanyl-D-glutamate--2,6-diaminopimelate ligase [Phycisphaerae bacterium]|nr:UDP-N-acetylmuramoyl-L-alanyl-D-glutamate--2,6-diaminopimelate ligase [Phycisphaerae bacterium]HRR85637.1 UDP-N-acetylmuramoyl-L-alanyl-D-glutamate--2,6-diaminopimelate ligase [Phycisphaerae bacterium]